ncbi:spore germination protein [Paenibacillus sp. yr247]|uniref:GerAB/ArcD/ProY family transporter n=1 Tax=Paenibacillus sp. yr247 TaxID=1761880 RepID=UPI000885C477|nr:endospore germination permease [Paenibacillus sp. yr247]SDN18686.1 spore germination protein [Paenibacillus sp. yr247]
MEYPRQVTVIQAAIVLISTIIGVGVLALSLFAVRAADSGATLVTVLGILIGLVGLWIITVLGMRFPTKSIIEYSEDLIGKWTARVFSVLIIAFFSQLTALASREFGEVVVTSVLTKTPLEVTVIVMLLLAALSSRADMTTFTYFHHFYFPVIVFPLVLIVVLSLKNAQLVNLLPVWGNEPSGMLAGMLTMAALFQGSFVMTIVIPAMRRPERAMIASYVGMLISGGLYLLIVVATVAVFGAEEIKNLVWPTLELAKTTSLPANILERLDGAFLAVWVTAVFTTLLSTYYLAIHFLSQLLRLRDHKLFSFFLLPFIYVIAMIPQNLLEMYGVIQIVGRWGLMITIGYPFVLLVVALIRKNKKKSRGDQRVAKSD